MSGQSDRMRAKEIHLVQRKPDPQNKPGRNESYSLNFLDFLFYNDLFKKKKKRLSVNHSHMKLYIVVGSYDQAV